MIVYRRFPRGLCPLAGLIAILLAGCGSLLAPRPDRTQHYVLSPVPVAEGQIRRLASRDGVVGIGPIQMPDYLSRSQRAVRVGDNQLRFLDEERWAESLESGIGRVLLQSLAARLPDARVVHLPTLSTLPRTYDIPFEILHFLSTPDGAAELHARWAIKATGKGAILFVGECKLAEPSRSPDAAAAVAAMSQALDRCGEEIAAELTRVAGSSRP